MAKVLFINNDGGGFSDYIEIEVGETVAQFLATHAKNKNFEPGRLQIHVNRQESKDMNRPLQDGDRVTVTPMKIDAGC